MARVRFGIRSLRPGQRDLIETVLRGRSAVGIMPTGAGKSLCYQLPALFLPKATVVVSPLLSLINDQTIKLDQAGISATHFDSTLSPQEARSAIAAVKKGQKTLIYVTPERLESEEYVRLIRKGGISLLVVDEAHCVSQWGHDFRPSYLRIREAAKALGNPPILALTATATSDIEKDILEQLGIRKAPVFSTGIDRPNLVFEVYRTVNEQTKFERLLEIVRVNPGCAIVYVNTIGLANTLQVKLLKAGIVAGKYHGKMKVSERLAFQDDFMHNRYQVMVATKAFGLGIDKPDVRSVVHYTFPDSIESYYQEAGRAGRDGKRAVAALLYRLEDKRIHTFFLGGKYPTRADAHRLYQCLVEFPEIATMDALLKKTGIARTKTGVLLSYLEKEKVISRGREIRLLRRFEKFDELECFLHQYEQRLNLDRVRIEKIMKYGQTTQCRARVFRGYFGEPSGKPCRKCDNCRGASMSNRSSAARA